MQQFDSQRPSPPSLPKIEGSVIGMALVLSLGLMQIVNIATEHPVFGSMSWAVFFLIWDALFFLGFYDSYKRTLKQRRKFRDEYFLRWLFQETELPPATDWAEIEDALGSLVRQGSDRVTFKDAVDLVEARKRQDALTASARAELDRKMACSHPDLEITLGGAWHCTVCGATLGQKKPRNPFRRPD